MEGVLGQWGRSWRKRGGTEEVSQNTFSLIGSHRNFPTTRKTSTIKYQGKTELKKNPDRAKALLFNLLTSFCFEQDHSTISVAAIQRLIRIEGTKLNFSSFPVRPFTRFVGYYPPTPLTTVALTLAKPGPTKSDHLPRTQLMSCSCCHEQCHTQLILNLAAPQVGTEGVQAGQAWE